MLEVLKMHVRSGGKQSKRLLGLLKIGSKKRKQPKRSEAPDVFTREVLLK